MEIFSVELGWLPTVGASSWKHYILPSITLGAAVAAVMARFTRASFVEVLHDDYIRTARAKGVTETKIVAKHALRNALIPVVTMMGRSSASCSAAPSWWKRSLTGPAWGVCSSTPSTMRDYPVIQASVLLFSLEFIVINLVVDVLYGWINPSIRYK